jgi:hypothetical protein
MNLFALSSLLEYLGTLIIALTALSVHLRMKKEKSVDAQVITQIGKEKIFAYLGIILLTIGFAMEIILFLKY